MISAVLWTTPSQSIHGILIISSLTIIISVFFLGNFRTIQRLRLYLHHSHSPYFFISLAKSRYLSSFSFFFSYTQSSLETEEFSSNSFLLVKVWFSSRRWKWLLDKIWSSFQGWKNLVFSLKLRRSSSVKSWEGLFFDRFALLVRFEISSFRCGWRDYLL